jgi:positive regulator of sigma E activity
LLYSSCSARLSCSSCSERRPSGNQEEEVEEESDADVVVGGIVLG